MEPLLAWKVNDDLNKSNSSLLISTLLTEAKQFKTKKLKSWQPDKADELEGRANKLRDSYQYITKFLERMAKNGDPNSRKRKLSGKTSNVALTMSQDVTYQYTRGWRSRRYSQTPHTAHGMSQQLRSVLLNDTEDIDMNNSIFRCLHEAVGRLQLKHVECFKNDVDTLKYLAEDRVKFCEKELGVNAAMGKHPLHTMVNGGACPQELKGQPGVQKLRDLARFLRWLSTSMMEKEFEVMREQPQRDKMWPEASCASTFYFAVEDHIATAMIKAVLAKQTQHLSLHYDGIRVDKARIEHEGGDANHMCRMLEDAIKKDTGYEVKLCVKQHMTFLQQLEVSENVAKSVVIESADDLLLKHGNCIPRGITAALGIGEVKSKLIQASQGPTYHVPGGVQSYREVAALVGCTLSPFVHLGDVGQHCVGLLVAADGTVHVHHGMWSFKTTTRELKSMILKSMDRKSMFFSKINNTDDKVLSPQPLLDLQAGASMRLFDCDMDDLNEDLPDLEMPDPNGDDDDEGTVQVEKALVEILEKEVKGLLKAIGTKEGVRLLRNDKNVIVCPFCVLREFRCPTHQGVGRFRKHVMKHHGGELHTTLSVKNYVASGLKQQKVIRALYDQQVQARTSPTTLL